VERIGLGISKLPEVARDNTDRNRTSPFAFTGNKFEFRAVSSASAVAMPIAFLNAAVADALGELGDALSRRREAGDSLHDAVLAVLREALPDAKAVCFEGNNYGLEWVEEAKRRGLPNLRTTPAALAELIRPEAKEFLQRTGVFSPAETEARYQVNMERYIKGIEIELEALKGLVSTHVLPAAYRQHALLAGEGGSNRSIESARVNMGTLIDELSDRMAELQKVSERAAAAEGLDRKGRILADEALPAMAVVREVSDRIEETVADDLWTLPKYREMLLLI
jgi:glutamine synthetase